MDTWKIFTWGIILFAVLLSAAATYGVAWGYEQATLQYCSSSTSPVTVYTPPSSGSSWTVVGFEPLAAQGSISCGPSIPTAIIRSNAYPWKGVYTCTGYSLKIRQSSATHGCVSYIVGTPTPASLGEISVDTAGVENSIDSYKEGMVVILSAFLFLFTFLTMLKAFRNKHR